MAEEEEEDEPYKGYYELRNDAMRKMPRDVHEGSYHRRYVLGTLQAESMQRDQIERAFNTIRFGKAGCKQAIEFLFYVHNSLYNFQEAGIARRRVIQMGLVGRDELPSPWVETPLYEESIMQGAILHLCIPLSCPRYRKTPWLTRDLVRMVRLALFPEYLLNVHPMSQ